MSDAGVYYPPETRVLPLTVLRRERVLPMPGKVLVAAGEKVQAGQVVAETEISGEVSVINVGQLLRVPPARAYKYLKVREGEDVSINTVIAAKGFLASGRIKSSVNGFVYRIDKATGRVLIKVISRPYELPAYLPGTVSSIFPGQGVVIETSGALIQGALGFGGEAFGVLQLAAKRATDQLKVRALDATMNSAIVVGGAYVDEAALAQAIQVKVRALIVGSLDGNLLDAVRAAPFPIILTEGLGRVPMSAPIFKLLKSNAGREASISALTQARWGIRRPEILIPLPADVKSEPPAFGMPLALGVRVRILRGSLRGKVGLITAVPERPQAIESGAKVLCAEVDLGGDDGRTLVPFANLEIMR